MTVLVIGDGHTPCAVTACVVERELEARHVRTPYTMLLHCGRPGVGAAAGRWACSNRIPSGAGCVPRGLAIDTANYLEELRRILPPMLAREKVDVVLRFPGCRTTEMMANWARACGVLVEDV